MLNYPEISESKIEALIAATIKNIVFLDKMKDGETRISHISELTTKNGKIEIEDIFVFDFARFGFVKNETEKEEEKKEEKEEKEEKPKKVRKTKKVLLKRKKIKQNDLPVIEPVANILAEPTPEVSEIQEEKPNINQPEVQNIIDTEPAMPEPKEVQPEPVPVVSQVIEPEPQPIEPVEIKATIKAEEKAEEEVIIPEKINKYKLLKEKIKQKREQSN